MIKNKKILKVLLPIFVFLILMLFIIIYFNPIIITDNVTKDSKIRLKLSRRFNKCSINATIYGKKLIDEIKNDIKKDKYIGNKDITYSKNYTLSKTCDKLYKNYKENSDKFILKGSSTMELEYGNKYDEQGYISKKSVIKINDIDQNKLGKQLIVYKEKNDLFNKYLFRQINIVDKTKPIITLNGKNEITIYINDKYNEPGASATDNYDGDITDKIVISGNVDNTKEGSTIINYKVEDSSGNVSEIERRVNVKKRPEIKPVNTTYSAGITYVKGILIVNKKYGLPKDYNPGVNPEADAALKRMQTDAMNVGLSLKLVSGFRSYNTQTNLYNNYVKINGQAKADTFSAKPGHSEHQTGLAFDVGSTKGVFAYTNESKWLAKNCHLYGFIIRYPLGKTNITGYIYEPWHIRYLGVDTATKLKQSGLTLEEYLGIN